MKEKTKKVLQKIGGVLKAVFINWWNHGGKEKTIKKAKEIVKK